MCSNASISPFPSVSCPVRRRFAGGISRRAPTPVRGGISARSWPTCSDVTFRSRGIAEAAAEWAVDPGSKVAVKVWAVEVLCRCRDRVGWVAESWDDIVEAVAADATPGLACRLRKSWRKV